MNFPSSASSIALEPYLVDNTLSKAVGVPPLCIYPSTVHLASSPVNSSSCLATFSPIPPNFVLSTPAPLFLTFLTSISPSLGLAPSATTTTLNSFPLFFLFIIFLAALLISNGISGIKATSAPPAIADSNAIQPAYLPITSSTIIL